MSMNDAFKKAMVAAIEANTIDFVEMLYQQDLYGRQDYQEIYLMLESTNQELFEVQVQLDLWDELGPIQIAMRQLRQELKDQESAIRATRQSSYFVPMMSSETLLRVGFMTHKDKLADAIYKNVKRYLIQQQLDIYSQVNGAKAYVDLERFVVLDIREGDLISSRVTQEERNENRSKVCKDRITRVRKVIHGVFDQFKAICQRTEFDVEAMFLEINRALNILQTKERSLRQPGCMLFILDKLPSCYQTDYQDTYVVIGKSQLYYYHPSEKESVYRPIFEFTKFSETLERILAEVPQNADGSVVLTHEQAEALITKTTHQSYSLSNHLQAISKEHNEVSMERKRKFEQWLDQRARHHFSGKSRKISTPLDIDAHDPYAILLQQAHETLLITEPDDAHSVHYCHMAILRHFDTVFVWHDIACDEQQNTPLHLAVCAKGEQQILQRLLGNPNGSPVHMSLMPNSVGIYFLNQQDAAGNTPLHQFVRTDNWKYAYQLIKLQADLSIKNKNGHTALKIKSQRGSTLLHAVVRDGEVDVLRLMFKLDLMGRLPVGTEKLTIDFNERDQDHLTAIELLNLILRHASDSSDSEFSVKLLSGRSIPAKTKQHEQIHRILCHLMGTPLKAAIEAEKQRDGDGWFKEAYAFEVANQGRALSRCELDTGYTLSLFRRHSTTGYIVDNLDRIDQFMLWVYEKILKKSKMDIRSFLAPLAGVITEKYQTLHQAVLSAQLNGNDYPLYEEIITCVDTKIFPRIAHDRLTIIKGLAETKPDYAFGVMEALKLQQQLKQSEAETAQERAEKEQERAEKERERAEKERERAEKERERAEKEQARAEAEALRQELEAFKKAHGQISRSSETEKLLAMPEEQSVRVASASPVISRSSSALFTRASSAANADAISVEEVEIAASEAVQCA